jgi:hypothetical protein
MKPHSTALATIASFALTATLAGSAVVGSRTEAGGRGPAGAAPSAHATTAASPQQTSPTCGPGPARVSDFNVTRGGFLKAPSEGLSRHSEFYFTRAIYSNGGGLRGFSRGWGDDFLGDGGPTWSIDYPSSDRHMMIVAKRLSNLDACEWEHPMSLADPELRRFPFLYTLEWGAAELTDEEVKGLHDYLLAGGLMMVDDFWGTAEYANFERQMRRVLPDHTITDIPRDNVLFRVYYRVEEEILQVPNVGNGRAVARGLPGAGTWEKDGYEPFVRGIFDDSGRLMVVIYANTDLGDALEWAEDPLYPVSYSTFAAYMFLNTILYSLTY